MALGIMAKGIDACGRGLTWPGESRCTLWLLINAPRALFGLLARRRVGLSSEWSAEGGRPSILLVEVLWGAGFWVHVLDRSLLLYSIASIRIGSCPDQRRALKIGYTLVNSEPHMEETINNDVKSRIIALVKSRENLWKVKTRGYKIDNKKVEDYQEIADEINKLHGLSITGS
ncbi:hypothetical protein QR680_012678 [Steinernema hermaphroditum]|uniref:Uncharacterized protein n=1 Tax=Steinernema hermaphroditum TaxID=289476 RepID=A0AA39M074_9BILA|nr:hypothetical protein QR680_012678 [Steinernema hermaphroditum]